MALDPSILLGIQQPDFSQSVLGGLQGAATIQNLQAGQVRMQQLRQSAQDQAEAKEVLRLTSLVGDDNNIPTDLLDAIQNSEVFDEGGKSAFGSALQALQSGNRKPFDLLVSESNRELGIGADLTARQREFTGLTADLSPEELDRARRIELGLSPRAVGTGAITAAVTPGLTAKVAESEAEIAGQKEGAKLSSQLKLAPRIKAAVTLATGKAAAIVDRAKETRSNTAAFDAYTTSIDNLATSLGGTITGPGAGLTPALTANAQIAEGAVAMMAPVLKGIFRTAGEGVFTDKDQELLLKMVPTRSTLPAARTAQLLAIDALVKAKLRQNETPAAPAAGDVDITTLSMEDLLKLQSELP